MAAESEFSIPALERFRLMSKNHKGEALVAMIKQALASSQIFVFGEILTLQNVMDLQTTQHAPFYKLLTVFAYGKLSDYDANVHPVLEPAALRKLQCLTIVSLANESKSIGYDLLFEELKVSNVRELEDLIIDAIYNGLIKAKMDQKARVLQIQTAVSRDIREEDMSEMIRVLRKWSANCQSVLASVENQVEITKTNLEDLYQHRVKVESEVMNTRQAILQDEQQKISSERAAAVASSSLAATDSTAHPRAKQQTAADAASSVDRKKATKAKSAAGKGSSVASLKSPKFN